MYFKAVIANSADLYKMSHSVTFHLGFHCSPDYSFTRFKNTKGEQARIKTVQFYKTKQSIKYRIL